MKPLCFVLMPFGQKNDSSGRSIISTISTKPSFERQSESAEMDPLRADEERDGRIIHKPMFERLILCDFALADLTLANANVYYELGVRHSVRPHTTVLIFEKGGQRLPFDVAPLRAIPYTVDKLGHIRSPRSLIETIKGRLDEAREPAADSPDWCSRLYAT